jgi:hypothetical protein
VTMLLPFPIHLKGVFGIPRKLIALTHLMSPGGISPNDAGSLSKELVLQPFSGALTSAASKPNETSQSRLLRYGNGRTRSRLDVVVHAEKIRGIVSPLERGDAITEFEICAATFGKQLAIRRCDS